MPASSSASSSSSRRSSAYGSSSPRHARPCRSSQPRTRSCPARSSRVTISDMVDVALGQVGDAYLNGGALEEGLVATRTVPAGELVPQSAVGPAAAARTTSVVVHSAVDVPAVVGEGSIVEVWAAPLLERGYDTPRILIPDATVVSVTRDESMIGGGSAALELVIPRPDVAAVLAAMAAESALSVVPTTGAAGEDPHRGRRAAMARRLADGFEREGIEVVASCPHAPSRPPRTTAGRVSRPSASRTPSPRPTPSCCRPTEDPSPARPSSLCDRHGVRIVPLVADAADERLVARVRADRAVAARREPWRLARCPCRRRCAAGRARRAATTPRDRRVGSRRRTRTVDPRHRAGGGARARAEAGGTGGCRHARAVDRARSSGSPTRARGFASACRQAELGELDVRELDRISVPLGGTGVDVLTGLNRPSRWPELSAGRVAAALAVCREWADYTVVDVAASLERDEEIVSDLDGPRRNAATLGGARRGRPGRRRRGRRPGGHLAVAAGARRAARRHRRHAGRGRREQAAPRHARHRRPRAGAAHARSVRRHRRRLVRPGGSAVGGCRDPRRASDRRGRAAVAADTRRPAIRR